ncbi:MAG: hypothetical protein CMH57_02550 [Myxococcales bacterium]|nr:hypothetical protein [Myxococcales bacterium]
MSLLDEERAKAFVTEHHYSGSYPAARLRCGLWRWRPGTLGELVGVAVFSVPCQQRVVPRWLGVEPLEGVEVGRFVLLDDVPFNGETYFLARAFRLLREHKPTVRAVVSYSDPVARRTLGGEVIKPGHYGTIYQAHNARFLGRSSSKTLYLTPDGRALSGRALSKIRLGERGQDAAQARLVELGLPERDRGESGEGYVARVLGSRAVRPVRHPGNFVYGWALDRRVKLKQAGGYPKEAAS